MSTTIVPFGGVSARTRRSRWLTLSGAAIAAGLMFGMVVPAGSAASADTAPVDPAAVTSPKTVSADALPTPQIDGVVWDQAVVGNTVYVAGKFTSARPYGAKAGVNESPRGNFLAYDLHTGELLPYAPTFNAQVMSLAVSPDGKRLYAAGYFTTTNDQPRTRLAAFDLPSGALVADFAPYMNASVSAVQATNSGVYVGGVFTAARQRSAASAPTFARTKAAAFSATDASVLPWAPKMVDGWVNSMIMSPAGDKIVLGGSFASLNGSSNPGFTIGAVDTAAGTTVLPWKMNQSVPKHPAATNPTTQSMYGLGSDGTFVYGVAGPALFEGAFKASWADGTLDWIADCHGDSYSIAPVGDVVYTASHAHDCGNAHSFGDYVAPKKWYRALALTTVATQKTRAEDGGYTDYAGQPSPTVLDWYPAFNTGTVKGQGPWDVTAAQGYVLYGGEFTHVNDRGQQGLVRFATPDKTPNKVGPSLSGADMKPTVSNFGGSYAKLSWPTNYDWDNANLTYQVIRNGDTANPVFTTTQPSRFWQRGTLRGADGPLVPGTTYSYQIRTVDPFGNATMSDAMTYTATGTPYSDFLTSYDKTVLQDEPSAYWPLNERRGGLGYDWAGTNNMSVIPTYVDGVEPGAGTAATFDGNAQTSDSAQAVVPPSSFSQELWFKTTAKRGGVLMGMGSTRGFGPDSMDRQIYMADSGVIHFASITDNKLMAVASKKALNDGQWHHVIASVGSAGTVLYIDGVAESARPDQTTGHPLGGSAYWNIGGHAIGGRPSNPASGYFQGMIDNVAAYDRALPAPVAAAHFTGGKTAPVEEPSYDRTVLQDNPSAYWPVNEASGSTGFDWAGTNHMTVVPGYAEGIKPGTAATFNGSSQFSASEQAVAPPTSFSQELWFKTTAKRGGVLMGMGSTRGFGPDSMDRQIYMADSGVIHFASITDNKLMAVASKKALNDGQWHHVIASVGSAGTVLYIDGVAESARPDQTTGHPLGGSAYWNIGGHAIGGRPSNPASGYFQGMIDNVAAYNRALTADTAAAHFAAAGVKGNAVPVASFTSSVKELVVSVDGAGSSDPDGKVASYAWDFGDGSTGTGAQASHTFAKAGTYTVALTVTDDRGGKSTVSKSVEVSATPTPPAPTGVVAEDTFGRSVASGWGSAVTGGAWTSGKGSSTSVGDGAGKLTGAKGQTSTVALPSAASDSTDTTVSFRIDNAPTGGGQHVWVTGRQVGADSYSARVLVQSNGVLQLQLQQSGKNLAVLNLPDVTYTPGEQVHIRFQVTGTGTTTLQAKVWTTGAEPESWTKSITDTTAALQAAGSVGLGLYVSGSATVPSTVSFDDYVVKKVAP